MLTKKNSLSLIIIVILVENLRLFLRSYGRLISFDFLFPSFLIKFPISGPSEETEVRTWEGSTGKHHC